MIDPNVLSSAWDSSQEFADKIYFKNKKKFKFIKYGFLVLVLVGFVFLLRSCFSASALTQSSFTSYGDLYSNDSYANRMLTFVPEKKKYVVARTGESEYIVFYSKDVVYSNSKYSSDLVNYVRYYRTGSSYNYQWDYESGQVSHFQLNPSGYVVTSNVNDYLESSRSWSYDDRSDTVIIKQLVMVFLPIILFANLWGCLKREFI